MTSTDSPEAGLVERQAELIDAIIAAYHTTRLSETGVAAHILSKPQVKKLFAALSPPSPDRDSIAKAIATAAGATWPQDAGRYRKLADAALSVQSPDREAVICEALKIRRDAESSGLSHPDIIEALGCFLFDETRGLLEQD